MRFDDLLVPEVNYPSGASASRREWLLMYSRGLPADIITSWWKMTPARVCRAGEKQILDRLTNPGNEHAQDETRRDKFPRQEKACDSGGGATPDATPSVASETFRFSRRISAAHRPDRLLQLWYLCARVHRPGYTSLLRPGGADGGRG